tara:strand:+ start:141 stop:1832 length:1692 start_codon:yes stop_codon:yes gene_type:complete
MVGMYIPEQKDDPNLTNQYFDLSKAGTLDVLGATFQETMYYNPINALGRLSEQYTGKGTVGDIISKDTWKESEYYRDGIEVGDGGIKEGLAQLLAERADRRRDFQITLQRSKGGFGLGAAQFGVAIAGSFLDPLNIASAFIPAVGPARMAAMAAKFGKSGSRAMKGAIDGAVGAAVLEPLIIGAAAAEQDDSYTLLDSFLNVAVGSALGGGLHVGFGKISDKINGTPPKTRQTAQQVSLGQALGDQQVKVDLLIDDAKTTTIKPEAEQPDTITVYDSEGQPRNVEKIRVDEEGIVTIKDTDGTEKVVDQSDVVSKSVYDEDYEIFMEIGTGDNALNTNVTLKELKEGSRTNADYIDHLEKTKEITELAITSEQKGRLVKQGIFRKQKKVIDQTKLSKLSANLKALDIAIKRANGETVVRPKDPVTNQVTEQGAKDVDTTESIVQTQEGAALTPQQLNDQRDTASIGEQKLGRLDEYAAKVDEMEADTAELGEIKVEDIEAENEAMMLELEDPEIINSLPDVARKTLEGAKRTMKEVDDAAEKARVSYDAATKIGAQCVIRSKS